MITYPTVIIGRKGSAGEIQLMEKPCWPSDTTFYLEWKAEVDMKWIAYCLTIRKPSPKGKTATLPSISRVDLENLLIPFPPLGEQRRVVARIEELMSRVLEAQRLREETQTDADRLWQSVLAEVFPKPNSSLPPGWRWVTLGEIAKLVNGKPYKRTDWSTEGIPIIRIQNLNDPSRPFNYWNGGLENQVIVEPGTVLIAWSGTPGTSFGAHFWKGPTAVLNQHIFKVDFMVNFVEKAYVVLTINRYLDLLINEAQGGVGLRHVTKRQVLALTIPLPPLSEQRRIVSYLSKVQAKITALKKHQEQTTAELNRLEQAILEKAFRGEL